MAATREIGWRRWLLVGGVAAGVIVADQLSKHWALSALADGSTIEVVRSFGFTLAFNTGMAFSRGASSGAIIGTVASAVVVALLFLAARTTSRLQLVIIGVVIGGAAGNVADRLLRAPMAGSPDGFMAGAVVDFIDVEWFAIFNVADAAVVVGCISLALLIAFVPTQRDGDQRDGDQPDGHQPDGNQAVRRSTSSPGSE